jgi:F0F1-type ATP synthase membrane subunit c/vacuolar-type H+-ATPase subunit K
MKRTRGPLKDEEVSYGKTLALSMISVGGAAGIFAVAAPFQMVGRADWSLLERYIVSGIAGFASSLFIAWSGYKMLKAVAYKRRYNSRRYFQHGLIGLVFVVVGGFTTLLVAGIDTVQKQRARAATRVESAASASTPSALTLERPPG